MRNLKQKETKNFKIELLYSEIDNGLWDKAKISAYDDQSLENQ